MHEDIERQLAAIGWSLRELSRRSQFPLHLVRDWGDTPHTQPPPMISKWLEAAVAWHEANPVPVRGAAPLPDEDDRTEQLEEALHRIASWADAYPLPAFPEPDAAYYAKAAEVLKANGMTLDRLSAAAMRHVITQVGDIAKGALKG